MTMDKITKLISKLILGYSKKMRVVVFLREPLESEGNGFTIDEGEATITFNRIMAEPSITFKSNGHFFAIPFSDIAGVELFDD